MVVGKTEIMIIIKKGLDDYQKEFWLAKAEFDMFVDEEDGE